MYSADCGLTNLQRILLCTDIAHEKKVYHNEINFEFLHTSIHSGSIKHINGKRTSKHDISMIPSSQYLVALWGDMLFTAALRCA